MTSELATSDLPIPTSPFDSCPIFTTQHESFLANW